MQTYWTTECNIYIKSVACFTIILIVLIKNNESHLQTETLPNYKYLIGISMLLFTDNI